MDPTTITIFIALGAFLVGFGSFAVAFFSLSHNRKKAEQDEACRQSESTMKNVSDVAFIKACVTQMQEDGRDTKHTVNAIDRKLDDHTRDIIRLQESDKTQWLRIEDGEKKAGEMDNRITALEQSHISNHGGILAVQKGGN